MTWCWLSCFMKHEVAEVDVSGVGEDRLRWEKCVKGCRFKGENCCVLLWQHNLVKKKGVFLKKGNGLGLS